MGRIFVVIRALWLFVTLGFAATALAQAPPKDEGDGPVLVNAERGEMKPQKGQVLMRIQPLADGLVREGIWSVLRVKIANGTKSFHGRMKVVEDVGSDAERIPYARDIEVPAGSVKSFDIYYKPGWNHRKRAIVLDTEIGAMTQPFNTKAAGPNTVTVGVVGNDTVGLQVLKSAWAGPVAGRIEHPPIDDERRVKMGQIPIATMPTRTVGYNVLDWVIWPDAEPGRASEDQLQALARWVANGGHLVVSVSDRWQQVRNSTLHDILPVTLSGVSDQDISPLLQAIAVGTDAVLPRNSLPTPVATASVRERPGSWTKTVASLNDGSPLWTIGTYGLGTVTVLTASPTLAPLSRSVSREDLWRRLMWLPPVHAQAEWLGERDDGLAIALGLFSQQPFEDPWDDVGQTRLRQILDDIPGVAPLPLSWLIAFSLAYLIAIGPADYLLLRLLNKQPWTWVTFPVTVIVFSTTALVGTSMIKGNQAVVQRVEFIDILPNTPYWRGDTYFGVFTTRKTEVKLRSGSADALMHPMVESGFMESVAITAGEGPGQLEYHAETWTLAYANSQWVEPRPGDLQVALTPEGLQVTNTLPWDLEKVELRGGLRVIRLGKLRQGQSRTVDWSSSEEINKEDGEYQFEAHLNQGQGSLDSKGWGTVTAQVSLPVEDVSIEGLSAESQAITYIRAPFAMPTALDAYNINQSPFIPPTVFDGVY